MPVSADRVYELTKRVVKIPPSSAEHKEKAGLEGSALRRGQSRVKPMGNWPWTSVREIPSKRDKGLPRMEPSSMGSEGF